MFWPPLSALSPLILSVSPSSFILQPPHASLFESATLAFINSWVVFISYSHKKIKPAPPSMQNYSPPPSAFSPLTTVTAHTRACCVKEHNSCQNGSANRSCDCATVYLWTPAPLSSYMRTPHLLHCSEPNSEVNNCTKRRWTTSSYIHTAVFKIRIIDFARTFVKVFHGNATKTP